MKIEATEQPGPEWDDHLRAFGGNLYHSAVWADVGRRPNHTPLFFAWRDAGGRVAAIAVGHLGRSSAPVIGRWNASLTLSSPPAIRSDRHGDAAEVLAELKRFARGRGCRTLTVESHMTPELAVDESSLGAVLRRRIEFRLDLAPPEENLWKGLNSHHRRKIGKALKQPLAIRDSRAPEDARVLRSLQKTSRDRRVERGETMVLGDDEPIVILMQRLLERGVARLFFAEHEGALVSGALLSEFDGRSYYIFGGSNETGFRLDAPGLLFWHMIRHYKGRSFREFNFGGVPAEAAESESHAHGLYRFKAGFGARRVDCCDYGFDLRPTLTSALRIAARVLGRS